MANAMDAYFRAKGQAMQQGQNMLAMENALRQQQREQEFRNVLGEAYTPAAPAQQAIPALQAAPAMGAIQPGGAPLPDYPAQAPIAARAATPGRFDVSGATQQLLGKGFIPEAMQLRGFQPKQQPGFTLGEGQIRYGPTGKEIARGPAKPGAQFMPERDKQAPWVNIADPKKRDEAKIRFGAKAETQVEKLRTKSAQGTSMNRDIDRFLLLNQTNKTGPGTGMLGARGAFDPEFAEMQSISDKLTPQMRQGMPGAASDRDVAMFRSATVGTGREYAANVNIGAGLKAANQNKMDKADFFSNYLMERGHTRGADQEWSKYLEDNPIFDPDAPTGSYELNENRRSWQEYAQTGGQPSSFKEGTVQLSPVMEGGQQRITSEGRPVFKTPQGDFVTERTVTVTDPRINNGKPTNIPTVFNGQILSQEEASNLIAESGGVDPVTGRRLQGFNSINEAVQSAQKRTKGLGTSLQSDKEALKWANANPNDPRAMKILQMQGGR